jgi:hypothetical protein
MACQRCGMPAQGDLCRDCERMEHQEARYGVPADHIDDDDDGEENQDTTVTDGGMPPWWPAGADVEIVRDCGCNYCDELIDALEQEREGVAVDGEHASLAAFEGGVGCE